MDLRERIDNAHTAWHSSELFLYPFTYILGERPGFQEYFDILPYDEQIFRNNIDSIKIQLKQQFSKQQFVKKTEIE